MNLFKSRFLSLIISGRGGKRVYMLSAQEIPSSSPRAVELTFVIGLLSLEQVPSVSKQVFPALLRYEGKYLEYPGFSLLVSLVSDGD